MNIVIQLVFFVAICAAVLPSSSAVPVDSEIKGEQAISMRDGDVVKGAVVEEMDSKGSGKGPGKGSCKGTNCSGNGSGKGDKCTKCIEKCRTSPNKSTCETKCKTTSC